MRVLQASSDTAIITQSTYPLDPVNTRGGRANNSPDAKEFTPTASADTNLR